ncbi:unnamed protein product [Brugia pahangi]|uniref:Uncharacterized protein n=1 Tax=Brugia pahangi TaxID=6280 RepID=A0A0N4TXH1_BRUPA|nr:unnamed protein product [Brugia pahangi]
MRLNRLIDHRSTILADEIQSEISSMSDGLGNFERLQQLAQLPIITLSKNVRAQDWKSIPTFSSAIPSPLSSSSSLSSLSSLSATTTATTSFYSIQQLLSLQYLLIAYAFISFAYSILLVLMLISYVQLIQLQ